MANYLDTYAPDTGFSVDEIKANEGLQVMFGMWLWGFGDFNDAGDISVCCAWEDMGFEKHLSRPLKITIMNVMLPTKVTQLPTFGVEAADDTDVYETARGIFISTEGPKDPAIGDAGIPNIAGIVKVNDYEVQVTVDGFDATAIYSLGGVLIAPMHYYGDESKYDYDNNMFGFDFGDLTTAASKTTTPMGAGPYKFVKYENKVVYFEANEYYYKGEPITTYVQFKETVTADIDFRCWNGDNRFSEPQLHNGFHRRDQRV